MVMCFNALCLCVLTRMHTFTVKDKKHIRSTAHLVKECSYDKKGQVRSYMDTHWPGWAFNKISILSLYSFPLLVKTECKIEL